MLLLGLFAMQPHFLAQAAPRSRSGTHLARVARVFVCLAAALAVVGPARAQKPETLQYSGYVNDFAGVLSENAKSQLTALCTELNQKTKAQIAVVTVKSLDGEPVEQYSIDLAQHWGVGPKQADRGVLILLAVADHKYRVEVGYGLEGILPDGRVGDFGRSAVPYLRDSNYDAALLLITRQIAGVIAQDSHVTLTAPVNFPARRSPQAQQYFHSRGIIVLAVVLLFLFFSVVSRLSGPRSGYTRRGGGGWWIGPMIGGGWGGGGGFGGGGGSGGFGGFGGGSFGGGGASGSW